MGYWFAIWDGMAGRRRVPMAIRTGSGAVVAVSPSHRAGRTFVRHDELEANGEGLTRFSDHSEF